MVNLQIEQFEALTSLAQAGITFPPEVYIRASQLRDKEKMLTQLKGGDDPEAQAAAQQEQELVKKLALERETAEIQVIGADAFQKEMDGMNKKADADIKEQELELTKRDHDIREMDIRDRADTRRTEIDKATIEANAAIRVAELQVQPEKCEPEKKVEKEESQPVIVNITEAAQPTHKKITLQDTSDGMSGEIISE